ncbi:LamB/YcsF family protein [Vandammella animalimorsus]|uniref:5-oxoprolinase subunit A n=1 Tax=Vandammella animalimorsus TaxID=2029117 RepID=A0A3M6RQM7_9BURK|nr:5-oxoprolinase subunit PxpA [Vandammella animalimorsus]RMX17457.1 LamB/YcsF family protein [Vandammella animalimorsus]
MDLNSDLGEGFGAWRMGDDAQMLRIVTSANVACGFHAGDAAGILQTLRLAAAQGVAIGAHVAYPDLVGFGRRNMSPSSRELVADVIYQIGALQGLARAAGTCVRYVKPHGALYNTIAHDRRQAEDVIEAMLAVDPQLVLMGLAGSPLLEWAQARGLRTVAEIFADRAYTAQGTLVPRGTPGAVLHDAQQAAQRMLDWVHTGCLPSIDGQSIRLQADSICVHGDSPAAVAMAQQLRQQLQVAGVALQPFAPLPGELAAKPTAAAAAGGPIAGGAA